MAEHTLTRLWTMRTAYFLLSLALIFFYILPLDTVPRSWTGPDLIVSFALAWSLRRPEYAPILILAGIMLLADMLLQRPPGLMAALVVIAREMLNRRSSDLRNLPFAYEWISVTTTLVAIAFFYRLVLALLMLDLPPMGLSAIQLVITILAYPLVVLVTQAVFGVRKSAPGEVNALGQRQ